MKRPIAVLFAVLALAAPPAICLAADDEATAAAADEDDGTAPLQDNLRKMETQLRRVARTTNPKARQLLLVQYLQIARENLALVRQMQPEASGCPVTESESESREPATPSAEAIQKLENRLDLIEVQLDKMLNEHAMGVGTAGGEK